MTITNVSLSRYLQQTLTASMIAGGRGAGPAFAPSYSRFIAALSPQTADDALSPARMILSRLMLAVPRWGVFEWWLVS